MQNPISRSMRIARRWLWLVVLGVVVCGGATYLVSKHIHPTYQASATIILELGTDPTHAFDNVSASMQASQTYAQLLASPAILGPVIANHPGISLLQLSTMLTVKPDPGTQLLEIDIQNGDPRLAMQLANEICQSFAQFSNTQLPGSVQILPAIQPADPIKPQPLQYAGIGALVGLCLAVALIILFEALDGRLNDPEEAQELLDTLDTELLASIPRPPFSQRKRSIEKTPAVAEGCRMVCTNLNAILEDKPCKLLMITSALAGEGKSTVAVNVATLLALTGKRVLLVDAHLRRPELHRHFHFDNNPGLANAFSEGWTLQDIKSRPQTTAIANLRVLAAGVSSSNPVDLLQSPKARQVFAYFKKAPFDLVIFDAPPLLSTADALALASHVQAAVLVIDTSKTSRLMLSRARRLLVRTHTPVFVVLNKCKWVEYKPAGREDDRLPGLKEEAEMPVPLPSVPADSVAVPLTMQAASNGLPATDDAVALTRLPKLMDE